MIFLELRVAQTAVFAGGTLLFAGLLNLVVGECAGGEDEGGHCVFLGGGVAVGWGG